MKFYFFSLLIFFPIFSLSQEEARGTIRIVPTINQHVAELGEKYYISSLDDSVTFETIKFYLGNLQFFQGKERIGAMDKKYLLIDVEKPASLLIPIPSDIAENLSSISFDLGIDSLTSVSGVFGGDLDPTNGMYWTWQSGYINVKLEGKADKCPARNHVFQFHLGGYQAPFKTQQKVELDIANTKDIQLNIALDRFLSQINLLENHKIMSPNAKAIEAAQYFMSTFSTSE